MTILILDGHNLLHRARSGFVAGDHSVAFNFFRGVRALVEQFKPTRVVMAMEGKPTYRLGVLPTYKANRVRDPEVEQPFYEQVKRIEELLTAHFPVSIVRHPNHEADDTIYNIINRMPRSTEFVVISSDSDFTQLLEFQNVKVYNPVKKSFVEWDAGLDYVVYKAVKGDTSDNIEGIPGIGEKKALKLAKRDVRLECEEHRELVKTTLNDPGYVGQFCRNVNLVRFITWSDEKAMAMTSSQPIRDWEAVKARFTEWEFKSITNDKSWTKFVTTFDGLFGGADVE
jgi:DNA polymerase-1